MGATGQRVRINLTSRSCQQERDTGAADVTPFGPDGHEYGAIYLCYGSCQTVVTLPPFVPHSWRNISDEPGQMFAIVTPGGCERLFIDIEAPGARTPEEVAVIERRLGIINEATQVLDGTDHG